MELPDFLKKYADPALRDAIPEVSYAASIVTDEEVAVIMGQGGRHSAEHVAAQIALGDRLIESSKEIQALGAFDARRPHDGAGPARASSKQLVFATHSVAMPFSASSKLEPALRYGAARAHNRHMADFCAGDERLIGVAVVPLDDPTLAMAELEFALERGLAAVWVPHRPCGDRSPGHVDFDPFWARPGRERHAVRAARRRRAAAARQGLDEQRPRADQGLAGRRREPAHQGHRAAARGPEQFLTMLVLDGVLERHPGLRGASVELGAGWVPELLRRLDWVVKIWSRTDANLQG